MFELGKFTLHSGETSEFKIDCDSLTDADIEAIAYVMHWALPQFGRVEGVPRGGLRLAKALEKYCRPGWTRWLFVDDVLTTGESMKVARGDRFNAVGAVIFARGECPHWIWPLFQMKMHPKQDIISPSALPPQIA